MYCTTRDRWGRRRIYIEGKSGYTFVAVLVVMACGLWRDWSGGTNEGNDSEIPTMPFQTDEAHAVIGIDTKGEKPIPYGMRGVNN
ncbi:hypothetical protein [Paenibacillus allorhizosphaerae]|uniref:hypothetical protein n=1 Tax=Paenibacillus allorhizosphaerae TaxID=2849866 RepID=UPI001C403987|nr:hypothetical protein [Paenibacillus allorhizosphaerae]